MCIELLQWRMYDLLPTLWKKSNCSHQERKKMLPCNFWTIMTGEKTMTMCFCSARCPFWKLLFHLRVPVSGCISAWTLSLQPLRPGPLQTGLLRVTPILSEMCWIFRCKREAENLGGFGLRCSFSLTWCEGQRWHSDGTFRNRVTW